MVYRECLPAGGKPFVVAALVMVDGADIVVQDRLAMRPAYLTENLQGHLVGIERVPMMSVIEVYPSYVVEHLRFPAPVAGVPVERKRLTQVSICLGVAPQMPAGDAGMAQRVGHAVLVRGGEVQNPRFIEISECLTGTGRALVGQAYLVERLGLASPVGQQSVDLRRLLSRGKRRLVLAGLLAHPAERQRRPRDPGRICEITASLQRKGVGGDRLVPVRLDFQEIGQH